MINPKKQNFRVKILIVILFIFTFINSYTQSITNTFGTGGFFTIKDATNTFFTLDQSTGLVNILGSLRLESTTNSSIGIIFKGLDRFLHNFQAPGTNGFNTFLGINAGNFTMSGTGDNSSANVGIGSYSLNHLTTGKLNTAVGYYALTWNTIGSNNTALGQYSLVSNSDGNWNTALGSESLRNNTSGSNNIAVGGALYGNTSGSGNISLGLCALFYNGGSNNNIGIGHYAIHRNSSGNNNTVLGNGSLGWVTSGSNNTTVGHESLYYTTGSNNTALGYHACMNFGEGNNVTCIGYNSDPSSTTVSNEITLGNSSITTLRCAVTTITALSDARDKKNIGDLNLGIDFIMKLKPRLFNWDKREWYEDNKSDGSRMQITPTAGFIAQELDEVQSSENAEWLNLVLRNNPDKLEATPGNLLPVMVKAIQQLNEKNEDLKSEVEDLKTRLIALEQKPGTQNPNTAGFNSVIPGLEYWFFFIISGLISVIYFFKKK